ncbi:MAG: hypothetical protein AAF654_01525 [Myxococcota bacterium]
MRQMFLVALIAFLVAAPAIAQRRDGGGASSSLEIQLKRSTAFGDTVLAAGTFRLSLSGDRIVFSEARTMLTQGTVPAVATQLAQAVDKATVQIKQDPKRVEIRLRYRDREYTVVGRPTELAKKGTQVDLRASKAGFGVTGGIPERQTDEQLVVQALNRYEKDIRHCGDAAHKQHWTTDHPRFRRCVCPLTGKWRLPKVSKDLRVHRPLAKRKSGYSITVTAAGKVADCRVWIGSKPPADEKRPASEEARGAQ